MDEQKMTRLETIVKAADDKLGQDIQVIDISAKAGICDHFVLVTGRNKNHTQAIADAIDDALAKEGYDAKNPEGFREGSWILIDAGDVIVHIFTADQRAFYGLENLWKEPDKQ
ncbi:MAG: ribosome silencing factor [Ndongobacter sp.]|nr:ribosome silencing factor [Ndongobacter sp.]